MAGANLSSHPAVLANETSPGIERYRAATHAAGRATYRIPLRYQGRAELGTVVPFTWAG
jgi:hypothetical protein